MGAQPKKCMLPTKPDVNESDFANIAVAAVTIGGRPVGGLPGAKQKLKRAARAGR